VQKAESALQGKQDAARKTEEVDTTLQAAKQAFDQGNYEEARKQAEQVLALDANRTEAQKVRDDSAAKIAETEAAAKKKAVKAPVAAVKKPTAVVARKETAPTPAPAPAQAASSIPILRLLFDSPVSEDTSWSPLNDQILLRKPFSFVRKEGLFKTIETGTVDVSIPVQTGALSVKVRLSAPTSRPPPCHGFHGCPPAAPRPPRDTPAATSPPAFSSSAPGCSSGRNETGAQGGQSGIFIRKKRPARAFPLQPEQERRWNVSRRERTPRGEDARGRDYVQAGGGIYFARISEE
jgi:hypothetical protein